MNARTQIRIFLLILCNLAFAGATWAVSASPANDYDERPVPVKAVPPIYPPEMLRERVSGMVSVDVLIDESGNVAERSVIKSSRIEFERPALDAVRRWKFKPAKKSGTAVKARLVLPIQFSFEG